ncbi:MAG TPA: glycosyltransferase family 4 protein [Candidatus Deferrimicrobium sp.]|nr:glycosyltransferase family 4 protein [Candidatus Deferrimicrobium sp.]
MNILQITPYFPPAWGFGGPVRHVYELSKFLAQKGHKVIVFTTNKLTSSKIYPIFHEIKDHIEIYRFPVCLNYKGYWITPALNRYLFKTKPDIIHIHSYRNYQSDIAYFFGKLKKVPFILTSHGSIRGEEEYNLKFSFYHLIRELYDKLLGKRIIRSAAQLIAVDQSELWHFSSLSSEKDKLNLIPNGINIDFFKNTPQFANLFREKNKIHEQFILSIGRLHRIKGYDFLIRAFKQILKEYKSLKLIIIGQDFGYKRNLVDLIQKLELNDSVILIDKIFDKLLIGAYSAASIYVQPSRFEVFGMALFEAAACEIPVIATNVGAFKNLITDGANGYIVNFNNIAKLKEICLELLRNESKAQEIGRNSRKLIKNAYSWKKIGVKIEKIYKKSLNKKNTI